MTRTENLPRANEQSAGLFVAHCGAPPCTGRGCPASGCAPWAGLAFCDCGPCSAVLHLPQAAHGFAAPLDSPSTKLGTKSRTRCFASRTQFGTQFPWRCLHRSAHVRRCRQIEKGEQSRTQRTENPPLPAHNGHGFSPCPFFLCFLPVFSRKPMTLTANCAILEALLCAMHTQTTKKRTAAPAAAIQ